MSEDKANVGSKQARAIIHWWLQTIFTHRF